MHNEPTTTFAKIKAADPDQDLYALPIKNARRLRKYGKNTPITVRQIVEAVGIHDALWCLRTMPEHDARWRLLALRYARRVQHLMANPRSLAALDVAERYAHGFATDEEMEAAHDEAHEAAAVAQWDINSACSNDAAAALSVCAIADATSPSNAGLNAYWAAIKATCAVLKAADVADDDAADSDAYLAECRWQADELIRICEEEI